MKEKTTNFVPQSDASKKASGERFKRFAATLADLHKEQQENSAKKGTKKEKGGK